MLTLTHLEARQSRLDELTRSLLKERWLLQRCEDPLLFLERRAYLACLGDAIAGVETARVTLALATQRLRRGSVTG